MKKPYITFEGKQYKIHRDKDTGVGQLVMPADVLARLKQHIERKRSAMRITDDGSIRIRTMERAGELWAPLSDIVSLIFTWADEVTDPKEKRAVRAVATGLESGREVGLP